MAIAIVISLLPLFLSPQIPANAVSSNPTPDCSAVTTCSITFTYSGDYYEWTAPYSGSYTLEAWGAQGGGTGQNYVGTGGKGGYAKGTATLNSNTKIYIYVGQQGFSSSTGIAFNGGGRGNPNAAYGRGQTGGGASHLATSIGLLSALSSNQSSVLLVAGGGGGAAGHTSALNSGWATYAINGGAGGGTTGVNGVSGNSSNSETDYRRGGTGGSQSSGGVTNAAGQANSNASVEATFGRGADASQTDYDAIQGGGGGGGWYGGGAGTSAGGGGGGGSGYVGSLTSTTLTAGNASMPNPAGGTMTGRGGDGLIRITYLNGPSVSSFTSSQSSPTNTNASITYSLSFSETVNTVVAGDFSNGGTATGCTFSPSASSGKSFTLTASNCSEGTLTPQVNRNSVYGTVTSSDGPSDTSAATTTITIDRTAPLISSADTPTAGTYSPTGAPRGPDMDFLVQVNESVTVSTSGGTPRLTLTVGASTQYASYISQSDSRTLTFRYTVRANPAEVDTNGITMSSSLDLNGGSITDLAGNALTNTAIASPPNLSSVLVAQRASAPTIISITPGDTRLTVAFTAGAENGSVITNYKYSLNNGASVALSPVDTITPVIIQGLTNGTGYSVRLIPVTAVGDGDTSTAVTETPTAIVVANGSNISTSYGRIDTSSAFTATGGTSPFTFSLSPTISGVAINATTGVVTTSSTLAAGSYSADVVATDTGSRSGRKAVSITVTKATPTFSSWSNLTKIFGDSPYSISAPTVTGSLAGTFTYTSSNTSVISIAGSTATVAGAGSATITALFTPTDTSNYETATTTNTVTVNKASQTITFGALSNRTLGTGTFTLSASDTSSSGLPLLYASTTLSTCSLSGADSRTVTLVAAGLCTITANQAGNANYDSATTVTRSFTIAPTLSITTPSGASLSATYNSSYTLTLSSSGGAGGNVFTVTTGSLPTGTSLNSSTGVISGTPSTAGNYAIIITVTDSNTATASTSSFTIAVARLNPTISLALTGGVTSTPIGVAITITATVSQNGAVTFKAGGSTISGCSSVASSGGSATCSWTPGSLGAASLTADLAPTDSTNYSSVTSSSLAITVITAATTVSLSFSSSIEKGKTITITATTTNIAGKVTFKVNGRNIRGCVNRTVSSASATCSWKVLLHGSQTVAALFDPTNNAYNTSSTSQGVIALRRTSR